MMTILVGKGLDDESEISLEELTLVKELGALKLPRAEHEGCDKIDEKS